MACLGVRGYFSASFSHISSVIFSGFGFFSGHRFLALKAKMLASSTFEFIGYADQIAYELLMR